jgi:hypothetical protein
MTITVELLQTMSEILTDAGIHPDAVNELIDCYLDANPDILV